MTYFQLVKTYPRTLGFGLAASFFSSPGQTYFIALFSPFIIAKFGLSNTEYGSLYSGATLASGILLPFIGPLIDRRDIRHFGLVVGLGLVVSQVSLMSSQSLWFLGLSLFGLRLFGQGLCSHITAVGTARFFTKNRGKALALAFLGFSMGEGVLTPLIAHLLLKFPWQGVAGGVAAAVALIFLPLMAFLTWGNTPYNRLQSDKASDPSFAAPPEKSVQKQWTRKEVFTHPTVYVLILLAMMPPFALTGVFFHQTAIGAMRSWPMTLMATGFVFFAGTRFLSGFIGGPLVDRFSAVQIFPWASLPLALGFFILGFFHGPWTPFFAFAAFGTSVGIGSAAKSSLWPELYGIAHLGAIKSSLTTIMVTSTAISPVLFGYVLDTTGEPGPLLYGLALLTAGLCSVVYLHLKYGTGAKLFTRP